MPRRNNRSRSYSSGDWGVMELVRERPVAAAAVAAGAAAAGLFLWSKRSQISGQLSNLSEQVGEWAQNLGPEINNGPSSGDGTGGFTIAERVSGSRSNANPGATRSQVKGKGPVSGRGRVRSAAATEQ